MKVSKSMLLIVVAISLPLTATFSLSAEESSPRSVSVLAEQSNPERLAKLRVEAQQKVQCEPVSSLELEAKYKELSTYKWDMAAMGCGVDYGFELANQGLFNFIDVERQLTILGSHIEYLDVLHKSYPSLYAPPAVTTELDVRWEKTTQQGQEIIARLARFWGWLAEFQLVSTVFELSATQHLSEHKEVIAQSQASMKVLNEILIEQPEALDALAPLVLGQLLLQLPEFNGGDPLQAIEVLKQGVELAPDNLNMHRWLIEAYVAEREPELALGVLEKAALISADQQHPQDHSDTLKEMVGYALSLQQPDLARYLNYQRTLILKQNPMLNPRQEAASLGHGGEDPITGRSAHDF